MYQRKTRQNMAKIISMKAVAAGIMAWRLRAGGKSKAAAKAALAQAEKAAGAGSIGG